MIACFEKNFWNLFGEWKIPRNNTVVSNHWQPNNKSNEPRVNDPNRDRTGISDFYDVIRRIRRRASSTSGRLLGGRTNPTGKRWRGYYWWLRHSRRFPVAIDAPGGRISLKTTPLQRRERIQVNGNQHKACRSGAAVMACWIREVTWAQERYQLLWNYLNDLGLVWRYLSSQCFDKGKKQWGSSPLFRLILTVAE